MKKIYSLLFALCSLTGFSQSYDYTVYDTTNSAIGTNYIADIKTDANGLLWLSTTNGVVTFKTRAILPLLPITSMKQKLTVKPENGQLLKTTELFYSTETPGLIIQLPIQDYLIMLLPVSLQIVQTIFGQLLHQDLHDLMEPLGQHTMR